MSLIGSIWIAYNLKSSTSKRKTVLHLHKVFEKLLSRTHKVSTRCKVSAESRHKADLFSRETLQQEKSNNLPGLLCIVLESQSLDNEEISGIYCDQEEERNLNTVSQALLLCDSQETDAIDGYLEKMVHRTVTGVENCSDADYLFGFLSFGRHQTMGK